jgi:Di-haem oxidoreductase, putative peroxidase
VATHNPANILPTFITEKGPVREARFVRNRDGTPDGGVHDLFVIAGRIDAPGCNIKQPDFAGELARNNVVFRIPTPLFGLGLVENISDDALEKALSANGSLKQSLGISGEFNRSGNDGTITRFGWKAQNKSLLIFAGEAYNVEQGVTNELFPNDRETDPSCQYTGHPEDATKLTPAVTSGSSASDYASDVVNFAAFMRFLAPPPPRHRTRPPLSEAARYSRRSDVIFATSCSKPPADRAIPIRTMSHFFRSATSPFTIWARAWPTVSRKETPMAANSVPRLCGDWASASSCCMTGIPLTSTRRSWTMPVTVPKPMQ